MQNAAALNLHHEVDTDHTTAVEIVPEEIGAIMELLDVKPPAKIDDDTGNDDDIPEVPEEFFANNPCLTKANSVKFVPLVENNST